MRHTRAQAKKLLNRQIDYILSNLDKIRAEHGDFVAKESFLHAGMYVESELFRDSLGEDDTAIGNVFITTAFRAVAFILDFEEGDYDVELVTGVSVPPDNASGE